MKLKAFLTALILAGTIITGEIIRADESNEFSHHEIQVGYGFVSMLAISATVTNALAFAFTQPFNNYTENTTNIYANGSWGPLYVNYSYYPLKWLGVGLVASYEQVNDTVSTGLIRQINWQFLTFLAKVNFTYGWEWVKFYHSLAAGFTYATATIVDINNLRSSNGKPMFAFHVTVFGIRVGKTVGVFTDFGIGYQGIINVGVDFKF